MTINEMITSVAESTKYTPKEIKTIFRAFNAEMHSALIKEERIEIPSIGTLSVIQKKARSGRNPKTGEVIQIPAKKTVKFNISMSLKEKLNDDSKM
jgi:Bacterial nucleoid DNA-binding protein